MSSFCLELASLTPEANSNSRVREANSRQKLLIAEGLDDWALHVRAVAF